MKKIRACFICLFYVCIGAYTETGFAIGTDSTGVQPVKVTTVKRVMVLDQGRIVVGPGPFSVDITYKRCPKNYDYKTGYSFYGSKRSDIPHEFYGIEIGKNNDITADLVISTINIDNPKMPIVLSGVAQVVLPGSGANTAVGIAWILYCYPPAY